MAVDETIRDKSRSKSVHTYCIKRFEPLSKQADSSCRDEHLDSLHVDVNSVECKVKALGRTKRERRLRVATQNFSGLGSDRKQKEVEELLVKNESTKVQTLGVFLGIDRSMSWKKRCYVSVSYVKYVNGNVYKHSILQKKNHHKAYEFVRRLSNIHGGMRKPSACTYIHTRVISRKRMRFSLRAEEKYTEYC